MILYPLAFISRSTSFVTSGLIMQLDAYDRASYSGSGTTVNDLTGSYTHTLTGASFTILDGIRCFACTTGNNRVVVNGTGPTLPTTGYTYITWARLMSSNSGFRTLLYTNSPKYTPITIPNGTSTLGYWDSSFKTSEYDVSSSSDTWVQFAVVGDSSSQIFYINGSQVGSTINAGSGGRTHWGWGNNDTAGQPWGHVANLFLYDRKLSVEEIIGMYNHLAPRFVTPVTSNLVLHYDPYQKPSYAGSGATLYDLTSNSLNGTLTNPTYNGSNGFTFNGTSSYGRIPSSNGVTNFTNTQQYTVEIWFNPSNGQPNSGEAELLEKWNLNNEPRYPYTIRFNEGASSMTVACYDGSTFRFVSISGFPVNTWKQLVAVFDFGVGKTLTVYKDGVSAGSASLVGINQVSNTSPVGVAGRVATTTGALQVPFKGTVGIIRMYDTPLTSTQVLQNFNADKYKYGL
jgi:hypothetical protein